MTADTLTAAASELLPHNLGLAASLHANCTKSVPVKGNRGLPADGPFLIVMPLVCQVKGTWSRVYKGQCFLKEVWKAVPL